MNYITSAFILFMLWFSYGLIHSAFASKAIKSKIGLPNQSYRVLFVIISIISLLPPIYLHLILPSEVLWENTAFQKLLGAILATSGIFVIKRAFSDYNLSEFIGLKKENESEQLITSGLQSKIRHPLYTGTLMFFYGWFFFSNTTSNFALALAMNAYTLIGIKWEEKKLIRKFGQAYLNYKEKVPSLLPKLG